METETERHISVAFHGIINAAKAYILCYIFKYIVIPEELSRTPNPLLTGGGGHMV